MLITSKYNGTCTACGKTITAGDRVEWIKGIRGVKHAACSEEGRKVAVEVQASRAADADVSIPAPDGLAYLPYQKAGIAYAMGRSGALLGDEMGLGKTIQAIGVINACPEIRSVLVICPKSLTLNWVKELRRWLVRDLSVTREIIVIDEEDEDEDKIKLPQVPEKDIYVVSYEEAKKYETALCLHCWDLLIVDEAHYIKNEKSARAKTVHAIGKTAERKIALTGTPIPNRPVEIFSILKLVDPGNWDQAHGKSKGGFFKFAFRYCGASNNGHGWDFSGSSNLPELQERLRATCMVRRLKADVLTELPPKRRQIVEVEGNGATNAVRAEREAWDRQEEEFERLQSSVELAKAETADEYGEAVARMRQSVKAAFEEISKLRHATALAKAPKVADHVRLALEADETTKIVVFAHHHDVIDLIHDELAEFGSVKLTGETKTEDRQAAVDRFQTDPTCRVFVGSITAAGVGITLTASAHVVFAELDWVPGNVSQAEDRCHRIGQRDNVLVQHLVLDGSLDARMVHVLLEKQAIAEQGLDREVVNEPMIPSAARPSTAATRRNEIEAIAAKLTDADVEKIHGALRSLAAMCDGALRIDGAGFNKIDSGIGRDLAMRGSLTTKQAALGHKLCRKYHRQVTYTLSID